MAIIGTIGVSVVAKVGDFAKGMDKVRRSARRTFRELDRGVRSVVGLGGALTALVAGGSLSYLVAQQLKAVDASTKFADRLGISTEALTGLQFAADLTGVSTNQLQLGLQRMTRRIAEAAQGTGEAKNALAELGLNAQELSQLTPDQQFRRVADAMQNVSNQSDRVRLGFKLFDSEGVALINTMRGGAEALDAMQKEAQVLGLTFDRVTGAKIEMANDAMTRLTAVATGFGRSLAAEVAPFITAAAEKLVQLTTDAGGMGNVVVMVMDKVASGVAFVADMFDLGKAAFKGLQSAVTFGISLILENLELMTRGVETVLNLIPGVEIEASKALDEIGKGLRELASEQLDDATGALDSFLDGDRSRAVRRFFDEVTRKGQEAAEEIAANAASRAVEEAAETASKSINVAGILGSVFDKVKDSAASVAGAVFNTIEKVAKLELEPVTEGPGLVERRFTSGFPGAAAARVASERTAENTKEIARESRTHTQLLQTISDRLQSGSLEVLSL